MKPPGGKLYQIVSAIKKRQAKRKLVRLLKTINDGNAAALINLGLENVLRIKKKIKPISQKRIGRNKHTARNWLELPPEIMLLIFAKLNMFDLLFNAQMVCSSWLKLSKEPCLFRAINIRDPPPQCFGKKSFFNFVKEAMDRSCGKMVRFSCGEVVLKDKLSCDQMTRFLRGRALLTDKIIKYASSFSSSLKYLELEAGTMYTDFTRILGDTASKLCQLQELHLHYIDQFLAFRMIEEIGSSCPNLECFQLDFTGRKNEFVGQDESFVIARYMPHLHRLLLINSTLTNEVLVAIIQGCPLLEHILLRRCVNINLSSLNVERIRDIRILNEANHEYKFVLTPSDARFPMSESKYQNFVETKGYLHCSGLLNWERYGL